MPPPLEARDYIGLGAAASPASSSSCSGARGEGAPGPHLALRLGLPGSESPGRGAGAEHVDAALTLGPAPPRGGAKRGFADSLDRPAKRDADAGDAAGAVSGEENKGVAATAAGAPRAAK